MDCHGESVMAHGGSMAGPCTVHGEYGSIDSPSTLHRPSMVVHGQSMVVHGDYHETTMDAKKYVAKIS